MTEKVKTVIGHYFLLPDFKFRGHPNTRAELDFSKTEINQKNIFTLHELKTNQTLVVNISKLTVLL